MEDSRRIWMTLEGFGWLLKALEDSERLWKTLKGFGRLWKALEDSKRIWMTLEGFGWLWKWHLAFNDFKFLYNGDTGSGHKGEGRWWGRRMLCPGDNLVITRNGIKECKVPRGARLIKRFRWDRLETSLKLCFSKCFSSSELLMMPMVLSSFNHLICPLFVLIHLLKWDKMREWEHQLDSINQSLDQIKEKYAI